MDTDHPSIHRFFVKLSGVPVDCKTANHLIVVVQCTNTDLLISHLLL
jgi:hypothetical protein